LLEEQTFEQRDTLKTQAHACDRDYQHTPLNICRASPKIKSMIGLHARTPATMEAPAATAMRTWIRSETGLSVSFCNLQQQPNKINGFLAPYATRTADQELVDTLKNVPSTVARCGDFDVCPDMRFTVRGFEV